MDHVKAVLSAAEQGNQQAIRAFLKDGTADVCDDEGSTPLMYAAANDREMIIRQLLQERGEPDAQNAYGWTALMQAAYYGHMGSVLLLLQGGAEVNKKNCWGTSALVGAARGGFLTIVQHLLKYDAAVNHTGRDAYALTPLMTAAQCGHVLIMSELLKHGSEVNARFQPIGWTALMLAVLNNQLEAAELLLHHGADAKLQDVNDKDAAQLARALGHNRMASLLSGFTEIEFFELVKQGTLDTIKDILYYKQEWASIRDKDGATPLMHAANKGYKEVCEVLVAEGAELNAKDSVHGWTALMQATHQRRHAIVEFLCKCGADVVIKGKNGTTAVDIADKIGDVKMIQLIGTAWGKAEFRRRSASESKMLLNLKELPVSSKGDTGSPQTPVDGAPQTPVDGAPQTPLDGAPRTPLDGTPPTPLDGAPQTPVGGTPPTPLDGTPRTPLDGTPPTPLDGTPPTPLDGAPQTLLAGAPRTLLAGAPRTPVDGAPQTPVAGAPQTPVAGAPRTLLAGAPRTPVDGASQTPVAGAPQTPVAGAPRTLLAGAPRTPVDGAPRTPVDGAPRTLLAGAPRTPVDGAPRTLLAGAPRTPVDGAPRTPVDGAPRTPVDGAPRTPVDGAPRTLLAGAPRTPLAGAPRTPVGVTPGVRTDSPLDPNVLIAHLQNAFKTPVFPVVSPPQSPEQNNNPQLRRFPVSAPTSLSSSLEEEQFASSAKVVGYKSPAYGPRHLPPKVQGSGALGKLLAGGAQVPAPTNVLRKSSGRPGQGLVKAGGVSAKQELPSLQKYNPPLMPLPLHAQLPRQQMPGKASVSVPRASVLPRPPMPLYGRMRTETFNSSDVLSREDHNPDLYSILAKHSLDHHFKLFSEQEVDYHSFLSLSAGDLRELGVCSEEEQLKLLELIELLNTQGAEVIKQTNMDAPVFVFQ